MSNFTRSGAIAMACLVTGAMFAAQVQAQAKKVDPKVVFGKVAEVTLYRGQAQVAREIELKNEAGPVELVVTDLPAHVVANSLFAEGSIGIEVRAVRYRRRAVGAAPREEVRRLEEQIQTLADDPLLNKANQALVAKKTAYLDKLEALEQVLSERTTLIFDTQVPPIGLFDQDQRAKAAGGQGQMTDPNIEALESDVRASAP